MAAGLRKGAGSQESPGARVPPRPAKGADFMSDTSLCKA